MKCTRSYVVFGMALLLSISLFVGSGWAETEWDVLSFVSKKGDDSPIILMNTRGATLERLETHPGVPSQFTWSLMDVQLSMTLGKVETLIFM
ncbi:hypothetical protein J5I95_09280 [Candidatus Poribacteria bacterium]|nr:hypothetical protein [Candidatus Poribacteria bacterium]